MTINEAIETLADIAWNKDTLDQPDMQAAIKLGIEALKRVEDQRDYLRPRNHGPLPAERRE